MKKLTLFLICCLFSLAASSQITDSTQLRNYINSMIVPNGNKAITATQLNTALNGLLNVSMKYRGESKTFYTSDGVLPTNRNVNANRKELRFSDVSNFMLTQYGDQGNIYLNGEGQATFGSSGKDNTFPNTPNETAYTNNAFTANASNWQLTSENKLWGKFNYQASIQGIANRINMVDEGGLYFNVYESRNNWTKGMQIIHKPYEIYVQSWGTERPVIKALSIDSSGNVTIKRAIHTGAIFMQTKVLQSETSYTVLDDDYMIINRVASGLHPVIILPSASLNQGRILIIREESDLPNSATIQPSIYSKSPNLNGTGYGDLTLLPTLGTEVRQVTIQSDGNNWLIIGH